MEAPGRSRSRARRVPSALRWYGTCARASRGSESSSRTQGIGQPPRGFYFNGHVRNVADLDGLLGAEPRRRHARHPCRA